MSNNIFQGMPNKRVKDFIHSKYVTVQTIDHQYISDSLIGPEMLDLDGNSIPVSAAISIKQGILAPESALGSLSACTSLSSLEIPNISTIPDGGIPASVTLLDFSKRQNPAIPTIGRAAFPITAKVSCVVPSSMVIAWQNALVWAQLVAHKNVTLIPADAPKRYMFAIVSDVHMTEDRGYLDYKWIEGFKAALSAANELSVNFMCETGDMTHYDSYSGVDKHAQLFADGFYASDPHFPFYACNGNHDQKLKLEEWRKICNNDLTYSFTYGNDLFVFLSHKTLNSGESVSFTTPFAQETINFLSTELEAHPDSRAFVFFHLPLHSEVSSYQYAGSADYADPVLCADIPDKGHRTNGYYRHGFTLSFDPEGCPYNLQNEQIISILSSHQAPTFAFHGHTHYVLSAEDMWPNVLFSEIPETAVHSIHVPSISEPRDKWTENIKPGMPRNMMAVTVTDHDLSVFGLDVHTGHPEVVKTYVASC